MKKEEDILIYPQRLKRDDLKLLLCVVGITAFFIFMLVEVERSMLSWILAVLFGLFTLWIIFDILKKMFFPKPEYIITDKEVIRFGRVLLQLADVKKFYLVNDPHSVGFYYSDEYVEKEKKYNAEIEKETGKKIVDENIDRDELNIEGLKITPQDFCNLLNKRLEQFRRREAGIE